MLSGLMSINVELTSRCNKGDGTPGNGCWMCGRKKLEREHPELCDWGDMPLDLVKEIARQTPSGVTVQLHNNGEPLLYPDLLPAIQAFSHCLTGFDTNGKLAVEKAAEIFLSGLNTLTFSVIQDDPEGDDQIAIMDEFLYMRQCDAQSHSLTPALVVFRLLGEIDAERINAIQALMAYDGTIIARRALHAPDMSRNYSAPPVVPEMGICLEALHKLSIDRKGNLFPCVRFNPHLLNNLGNMNYGVTLEEAWNGPARKEFLKKHMAGMRDQVDLCQGCHYFGIPRDPY